jgi:16S rRNA (guanine527-N7)-methyltransferase
VNSRESRIESLLEGAQLVPATRERLARYGELVLEANRRFNLTGAKHAEDLAEHLLDSLSVVPHVREPYVDIGSGAGFPAIPVALATGVELTMIEATAKKAYFLETVLDALNLKGRVLAERAEIAAHRPELRERFASGTARALGSGPTVAELLLPLLAIGGAAILQRGILSPEEQIALADASLMLGGKAEVEILLEGSRRIILVRKDGPTPARFPRRTGVPAKRPLCL